MTLTTKIPNELICDECEKEALRSWRKLDGDGLRLCFTYCEHTSRSLIIEGIAGENPDVAISNPSDRETLEATWRSYRDKRIAAQQYAREIARGGERRH